MLYRLVKITSGGFFSRSACFAAGLVISDFIIIDLFTYSKAVTI